SPEVRAKILGMFALLITVNGVLWLIALATSFQYPLFLALAATAFALGLRHAVDADHIAAIDNVTRKLMQEKKRPVAVGFFFSLGHSTVVFVIAVLIGLGATAIRNGISNDSSGLEAVAGLIGTSISALFLLAMAAINIVILVQIVRAFRDVTRGGAYREEEVDAYLNQRGFFARIFRGVFKTVDRSWKMYPVGFLFGLGFDTATEIGLFVIAGSVGALESKVPGYTAVLLPLMFTAGMCLMDTIDGVMMLGAYGWAFVKPIRKLFYNMTITLISVIVALLIGGIEVLSIVGDQFQLQGPFWNLLGAIGDNSGWVGAGIIAIFILSWLLSTLIYRINKYDDIEVIPTSPSPPAVG
ncbi:MAG TPA: HoxN/HupN/NixA family nickel/cobalt transporter, partial [Ktedonobacterales bacterium]|nr:HoxN/HupN/NixA family nickel/cobalt transporter [Ktedonobacterales bacterium]